MMLGYILLVTIFAVEVKSEECPLGTYRETCDKNCSTNCAPSASDKKVHCHKLTGKCSEGCNAGWHGDQCNLGCSRNCRNYVCNVQTGTCIQCKANYSGDYCETYEADTDLHDACKDGNLQRVRYILDQSLEDINKQGKGGMTPVMWAARRGHRELVDLLVKKGANLALVDDVGNNILHWACYGGHIAMVKHVVSKNMVDTDSKGRDGRTPLMCAARHGNKDMFLLLVSKGGLPSHVDRDGNNVLHLACWGGNKKIVDYILSHDDEDINGRGQCGRTPLMAAAYKGHGKIFDLLVTKGADPTQFDDAGESVLNVACVGTHVDIVSRVLKLDKVDTKTVAVSAVGHH
ncbi:ankyrin repeat domain-containing protein 50-like [Haliotis rubra]|uniref:ankyrin repeat domain-containing protein 50-like n=1 Tax=Haliotis rubra TaxID=36100 RepID=UPI001EE61F3D|nr:ankyrin repeat domain-containing protein 50-like [Haliotis rubra]